MTGIDKVKVVHWEDYEGWVTTGDEACDYWNDLDRRPGD